jgi:hypothetical protein
MRREAYFRARNGMTAMAVTPALPEATRVGALSAQSGSTGSAACRLPSTHSRHCRHRLIDWFGVELEPLPKDTRDRPTSRIFEAQQRREDAL